MNDILIEDVLQYSNYDLDNIFTPVDSNELDKLLKESQYDNNKRKELVQGFRRGFDLGYRGKTRNIKQTAKNLKFTIGNKKELWNKVMKEVKEKRYAGPFKTIPFEDYIQSPIGLVPKDNGKKTRLIFHLSYPRNNPDIQSVNSAMPEEFKTVQYQSFDDAIKLCIQHGIGCAIAKSDMTAAFRHLPMMKKFWKFLVMKAENPTDGKIYYFIDKCMPFGAAISCANFQSFSDAVSHIVTFKMTEENINYLDDFFFVATLRIHCNQQVQCFTEVCKAIRFPVSQEKTFWACKRLTFLGLLIDTELQMIFIPIEKIDKALELIRKILNKKRIRLRTLQQMTGYLNFLGKSVVPGRAFTRRLYANINPKLKKRHHLPVTNEMKLDLEVWRTFLESPDVFSRKFIDLDKSLQANEICMYSDASANKELGCGGYNQTSWYILQWDEEYMTKYNPSINYLELYAVTVAIHLWIHRYKNKKIILFCDNMSVVHMINKSSSKCANCMVLIRLIILQELTHNVKINAKHVRGKSNTFSDMLSRLKYREFRAEA